MTSAPPRRLAPENVTNNRGNDWYHASKQHQLTQGGGLLNPRVVKILVSLQTIQGIPGGHELADHASAWQCRPRNKTQPNEEHQGQPRNHEEKNRPSEGPILKPFGRNLSSGLLFVECRKDGRLVFPGGRIPARGNPSRRLSPRHHDVFATQSCDSNSKF